MVVNEWNELQISAALGVLNSILQVNNINIQSAFLGNSFVLQNFVLKLLKIPMSEIVLNKFYFVCPEFVWNGIPLDWTALLLYLWPKG